MDEVSISPQYLAGFLDGEGTLRAFVRERRGRKEIQLEAALHNVHEGVVRAIQRDFGGSLEVRKSIRLPIWRLRWNKKSELYSVLQQVRPFIVIKKPQVEALLEFLAERDETQRVRYSERDFELVGRVQAANALQRYRAK